MDLYTGTEVKSVVFVTTISIIALAAMRTLRNVSAAPCAIMLDTVEGYFDVVTMFRVVSDALDWRKLTREMTNESAYTGIILLLSEENV